MTASELVQSAAQDVRYAVRNLRRSPTFTTIAVLTLAFGIAATAAIFSMVNAALLRPLPYPRSNDLIDVRTRLVGERLTSGLVSPAEIGLLAAIPTLVSGVAGYSARPFDSVLVQNDGTPVGVVMYGVTDGFFELLGVPIQLGRAFTREEHVTAGLDAPVSIVISDGAWTRLFGRDPAIVGKTIRLAEMAGVTTIIGVASPLVDLPRGTDFWFNGRINPQQVVHVLNVVARLQPGVAIGQLRSAGNIKMQQFGKTDASADGREWVLRPLVTALVGDLGPVLWIVLGATLLLLALACVNVTNLLLARGMARTSEMALRTALGASRGRIVRQLLTESMALAAAGAALGFVGAVFAVRGLLAFGGSMFPRLESVPLDARMLLFGVAVLMASGLVVGLLPAWRLSRADVRTLLNESSRSTSAGVATSSVMSGLVVAEIALAIAVVAGAGWLLQGFWRLSAVDPGFVPDGRLVVDLRPTRTFTQPAAVDAWLDEALGRVRAAAPGARVGAGGAFPLRGDVLFTPNVLLDGEPADPNRMQGGYLRVATPGYFEAMGIKLVAGRVFTEDDRRTSEKVVVVNRAFVRRFYPNRDPLAGAFAYGYPIPVRETMARIVGVVDDVRFTSLAAADDPAYYLPANQAGQPNGPYQARYPMVRPAIVIAASNGNATSLIGPLRDELRRFDAQLLVGFTTAEATMAAATSRQALGMGLMMVFGTMALLLAAIGVYGVIAYGAEQRRMELATRLALGAAPGQIFQMMLRTALRLAIVGLALGVSAAYGGGRLLSAYIYAMRAADPWVIVTAGATVAAVTVAATMIPALRASRLSPVRALRLE